MVLRQVLLIRLFFGVWDKTTARTNKNIKREYMFDPIKPQPLYIQISNQITETILSGDMEPGDRLPTEIELANQFDVSKTVVREAIKILHAKGLVEVAPRRGIIVTKPGIDTLIEGFSIKLNLEKSSFLHLLSARKIIEVPAAGLAAENSSVDNVNRLHKNLLGMKQNINNLDGFINNDTAFHAEIGRATQNQVLAILILIMAQLLNKIRQEAIYLPEIRMDALTSHENIFSAIKEKDPNTAEKEMSKHLDRVIEYTIIAHKEGLVHYSAGSNR